MTPLDDTQRLDAIQKYGLCLATEETRSRDGDYAIRWIVCYGTRAAIALSMRSAIDAAVLDITTNGSAH